MSGRQANDQSAFGLNTVGLTHLRNEYWNLGTSALRDEAVERGEGSAVKDGPLVIDTGKHTTLTTNDRFVVQETATQARVNWGPTNRPFSPQKFNLVLQRLQAYFQERDVFVQDRYATANTSSRLAVRVVTDKAWHSLYARNLLASGTAQDDPGKFAPELTVICASGFHGIRPVDGTESETFILINLDLRLCLIGGTAYAGEIRRAIFTAMSYLMPEEGVLPIRGSASRSSSGTVALFLGGYSSDRIAQRFPSDRHVIGDDELGWTDEGLFGIEAGCHPGIGSSGVEDIPKMASTLNHPGTTLENRDSDDARLSFTIKSLGQGDVTSPAHPAHIFLLVPDGSGIFPPLARLSSGQAALQFLCGYSREGAKISFDPCFGAQFMVHHPAQYARMLRYKIERYGVSCWLLNTGWIGDPAESGTRVDPKITQTLVETVFGGNIESSPHHKDPLFGFEVIENCDRVPSEILDPSHAWKDQVRYEQARNDLGKLYTEQGRKLAGSHLDVIEDVLVTP